MVFLETILGVLLDILKNSFNVTLSMELSRLRQFFTLSTIILRYLQPYLTIIINLRSALLLIPRFAFLISVSEMLSIINFILSLNVF